MAGKFNVREFKDVAFCLDSTTQEGENYFYMGHLERHLAAKTLIKRIDTSLGYCLAKQDYVCNFNGRNLFLDSLPTLAVICPPKNEYAPKEFKAEELIYGKTLPVIVPSVKEVEKLVLSDHDLEKICNDFSGLSFMARFHGNLDIDRFAQEFSFRKLILSYRNKLISFLNEVK